MSFRNFQKTVLGPVPISLIILMFHYFPENQAYNKDRIMILARPSEELQRNHVGCRINVPGFELMLYKEQDNWRSCMDSISYNFNPTETLSSFNKNIDASGIPYCENQEIYKHIWLSIMHASDTCMKEVQGIAGAVYLPLQGDLCADEIWIILVSKMKSNFEISSCLRNYSISDGKRKQLRQLDDGNVCLRFRSNFKCDPGTFDPNCNTNLDTELNGQNFEKVRRKLKCLLTGHSKSGGGENLSGWLSIFLIVCLPTVNIL